MDQACSVKKAIYLPDSFFVCQFMDIDSVSAHKHTKKDLGQLYPAIWTLHLVNILYCYMASSVSGQDISVPALWLATWVGKTKLHGAAYTCSWPVLQEKFLWKTCNKSFISRVCLVNSVSVHKHTKKELSQYPAILTSHLNNPYSLYGPTRWICSS